jgi:hypothetical protein
VKPPIEDIHAPTFPPKATWINVATLRMDKQRDRPVLVEFFDFCRVSSLRTLPYLKAWHERYEDQGLRVVSVHAPGYEPSHDEDAVKAAVARLGIEHAVMLDHEFKLWRDYGNQGWPSRWLWRPAERGHHLHDFHYGEGAYAETERAIQELLGDDREPVAPVRPEDDPGARIVIPTSEQEGAYSGPYEAGAVWAVLSGAGTVTANGRATAVDHPGAYALVEHERHTAAVLDLEVGDGVTCHAVAFTPGLAP